MRGLLLAAVFAIALPWSVPAVACSIISEAMIFFAYGSADLNPHALRTIQLAGKGRPGQMLPSACQSFVVTGYVDTAEAATFDPNLAVARAAAVGHALEQQRGGRVVQI